MASTPFLADLTDTVATGGTRVRACRRSVCWGADPGPLVERAQPTLGTTIVSAWGMSENGAVTTTMLDDDPSRAVETDGCPCPA